MTIGSGAIVQVTGSESSLAIYGNVDNSGTFTSEGTTTFGGSATQTINGSSSLNVVNVNNAQDVEILAGSTVNVEGYINLSDGTVTTNDALTIELSTGGISGSGNGSIVGNVTYKRTIPQGFHYIYPATGSGSLADFTDDMPHMVNGYGSYYYYKESVISTDMNVGGKPYYSSTANVEKLEGIAAYIQTPSVDFDVTGPYDHNASYSSKSLSYTPSGNTTADGWHLIGNPYPSTIDWDASGWTKTNLDDALYLYDGSTGVYSTYISGVGLNGATSEIAPFQAFFVKANAENAKVEVTKEVRKGNPTRFYRRAPLENIMKVILTCGNISDETVVRFSETATMDFDAHIDAVKFQNPNVSVYTTIYDKDYAINALPDTYSETSIPLIVKSSKAGKCQLTLKEEAKFDDATVLYLEDHETGEFYDVKEDPLIEFDYNSDSKLRYSLVTSGPVITSSPSAASGVKVLRMEDRTIIKNVQESNAEYVVLDVSGKIWKRGKVDGSQVEITHNEFTKGLYLLKISGQYEYTEKILIY